MSELELQRMRERIRRLAAEVSLAEERERRQIASDLHDHLGQSLAFIKVRLAQLRADTVFSGGDTTWAEIMTLLDQSIRYTRTLTCEISPPVLYDLGLAPALVWLADEFQRRRGLHVTARVPERLAIGHDMQVILFKSVRELLLNVIRHAGTDRAQLTARLRADRLEIEVRDEGVGFVTERVPQTMLDDDGFGLFSARERMEALGGGLRIESEPGRGTTATLWAPLTGEAQP